MTPWLELRTMDDEPFPAIYPAEIIYDGGWTSDHPFMIRAGIRGDLDPALVVTTWTYDGEYRDQNYNLFGDPLRATPEAIVTNMMELFIDWTERRPETQNEGMKEIFWLPPIARHRPSRAEAGVVVYDNDGSLVDSFEFLVDRDL